MAITASYLATVSVTGTSTGLTGGTGEPMTDVSGGARTSYQITDATKRIVDPATAIVIYDNNTAGAWAGSYTMDYLNGTVTLSPAAGALGVKIQGNYLPARQITQAYEVDASLSKNLVDTSLLGTAFQLRTPALGDASGTMSCYDFGLTTYGGDVNLKTILLDGTAKVVEIDFDQVILRFFALFESIESSASVDGVQSLSASFSMSSQTALTTGAEVDFGWSA